MAGLAGQAALCVRVIGCVAHHLAFCFSYIHKGSMDANDNHTSPPPSNEHWQEEEEEDQPHSKRMKVRDTAR